LRHRRLGARIDIGKAHIGDLQLIAALFIEADRRRTSR